MKITQPLADFIVKTRYEDLSEKVIELAKHSFLDTMGITIGGSNEEGAKIICRFVRESGGTPVASLVGQGVKSAPQYAALFNGTAADILVFSDHSSIYLNHPSEVVCPAIWALAEQYGSSGKDVILAQVIGTEVSDKIGAGVNPHFHEKGWDGPGVLGTFGATAAASKLLGLDPEKIANAIGIAGAQASGMKGNKGSLSTAYRGGRAAENGIVAARLAQMGFTGRTDIMENRGGFLETFGDGADGHKILEHLGNPFEFIAPGITFKPYPSCGCAETVIKGVLTIKQEQKIGPDDVESVECSVSPMVADILRFPNPKAPFEAKYSLPFCVATALIEGKVGLSSFSEEKIRDPKMLGLMKKVKMVVSPDLAKLGYNPHEAPTGCTTTIKVKKGEKYTCRIDRAPWAPETPPSWEELVEKYRGCAELVLTPQAIEESIKIIRDLEKAKNIFRLMDIVRG